MSNNRIKVSDLDYNQIRENLKTFMRGQDTFSDYDFEGSALSVILDVLAYNTHYNALYTNLAINEMFIDSASKRSSVVSIANNFGYLPRSCSASKAIFDLVVTQQNATTPAKFLAKFTPFNTTVQGEKYTFYTIQDYIANREGNTYTFKDVEVYEGTPETQVFLCSAENQRFPLPNIDIDISTISVTIQETGEKPDFEKYELARSVLDLNADSKVHFLKELDDGTYELYFGTNNLGKPIQIGNIVTISYIITNKALANSASLFTYEGDNLGGTVTPVVTSVSFGGQEAESVAEIKKNLSQAFFDQNRAVTVSDYSALIKRLYSNAESVSVWGGEDNVPQVFGKVFISIKPSNSSFLTPPEKAFIKQTLLKSRNVVSVLPELVDPTFLELGLDVTVYYDPSKTTRSADDIRIGVIEAVTQFRNQQVRKFNGVFRMSKFARAIDDVDTSIQSNISTLKLYTEVIPKFNSASEYKVALVNPIFTSGSSEESFTTTGFFIDNSNTIHFLDDDGVGNIRLYNIISATGKKNIINNKIGTIDYATGTVHVKGLRITNLSEPNFYFIFKTSSYDVVSVRNQIIDIPLNRLNVTVIQDQTNNSGLISGYNYKFTTSR